MRKRTEEFYSIYFPLYDSGKTQAEAYEETERQFEAKYNHRHYSSFGSFSVSLYSRNKTLKEKLKIVVKTL
jgi:hypothetical protein